MSSSVLVVLVIVAGWLDANFFQRTRLLTPIPSDLMPMVWGMRLLGAALAAAPALIVLRLGFAGRLFPRNMMLALGALPVTIFVMNSFAWRIADAALFRGGAESTSEVECPVLDFGGRSNHYAIVDCDGTGRVSIEILDSYFEALAGVKRRRAEGAAHDVCLQLAVQKAGRNERLVLPSMFDARPPRLSNCTPGPPSGGPRP